MKMKNKYLFVLAMVLVAGCTADPEKPVLQYMPHMSNTPVLKPQRGYDGFGNGAGVLVPPAGTIPRGYKPYRLESAEIADQRLKNPLPIDRKTLERGKQFYGIYCYACHGDRGLGDGPVVPPFPIPKSLQTEQMLKWGDGHLFHVITKGQGVMPAYAEQISEKDRWAIIHYVRVLQRAEHPTAADVKAFKELRGK